jgi:UTP--glucose-1-phosphate uridylyltransferase
LIQYAVEEALEAGIDTLIFITSRKKHAISDHFDTAFELQTRLSEQGKTETVERIVGMIPEAVARVHVTQPEARGLGHAVLCAESVVGDEPFAVILADDMILNDGPGCLSQMVTDWERSGASLLGVETIPRELTGQYGVVSLAPGQSPGTGGVVDSIVEKPHPDEAPSNLGVVGRYILDPAIFGFLHRQGAGAGGEIQLTDAIAAMLAQRPVHAFAFEGTRFDCGSRAGFIRATLEYAMQHEDLKQPLLDHMRQLLARH